MCTIKMNNKIQIAVMSKINRPTYEANGNATHVVYF